MQYKGWVIGGVVVCALTTPVVPLVLLFTAHCVTKLDENAERMLAWRAGLSSASVGSHLASWWRDVRKGWGGS